jgi:CPA2 family monovalent cation:H+ antiporter-2
VAQRGRLRAGAALVARGEFSIVIAGLAVAAGHEAIGPLASGYVVLLGLLGPLLARFADQIPLPPSRHRPVAVGGSSAPPS